MISEDELSDLQTRCPVTFISTVKLVTEYFHQLQNVRKIADGGYCLTVVHHVPEQWVILKSLKEYMETTVDKTSLDKKNNTCIIFSNASQLN